MNHSRSIYRQTESVCPICLARIPAKVIKRNSDTFLEKKCPEHGEFSTIVWREDQLIDQFEWGKGKKTLSHPDTYSHDIENGCPFDCGICPEHQQRSCCVLLEITSKCDQACEYCFASSEANGMDLTLGQIQHKLEWLVKNGLQFIQLSGGEPTLRDDLPEIVRLAKSMGITYIQLNTNGTRLAEDPELAQQLSEAGLSSVFMQFDGTTDEIHFQIRGTPLMGIKEMAIKNCSHAGLGVVLVSTLIPGINTNNIGDLIQFGVANSPTIRGVHFQPVSYFGRFPQQPFDSQRITLPEVLNLIESQTKGAIQINHFNPTACYHPDCGFHGDFMVMPDSTLRPLGGVKSSAKNNNCCVKPTGLDAVEKNRSFVLRRWAGDPQINQKPCTRQSDEIWDLDDFLSRIQTYGFAITGMLFQDCWNIDLDRLKQCSLHVICQNEERLIPFCAYYLTDQSGNRLY